MPRSYREASAQKFSTVWKTFSRFFHTMDKYFPHCGKKRSYFSQNGKTFQDFSTQWKECFHGVENLISGLFYRVFGCSSGDMERSPRRPLSIVDTRPAEGPGKTAPDADGQCSQPRLPRVRRRARPFFLAARSGISRALRCEGGRCVRAWFNRGLL